MNSRNKSFTFKQFTVCQDLCAMKVGTDGVLLGAWAKGGERILDIGCGTGLISLMLAQRNPEAKIVALDIDEDCCRQAEENVKNSPWTDRVEVCCSSFQQFSCQEKFDCIVSNPPFFVDSLKNPDAKRTLARHSDSLPFAELIRGAGELLMPNGRFSVILPEEVVANFVDTASVNGLFLMRECQIKTVSAKPVRRRLLEFSFLQDEEMLSEQQCLMNSEGKRSAWFADLTSKFYL